MDAKALAKSKRAHTLHHNKQHSRRPNPNQRSKSASEGGSGEKAVASGNQRKENPRLPSNWDRYEEEEDDDDDASKSKAVSGVVLPKSKGADFRHLIGEAQSQSQSQSQSESSSYLNSLEEVFAGDLRRMLAVRGEGILSWIADDNFVVDDETAAAPEASFLSLNLNALAEQLEKVDLAERLFIEADLLPPELSGQRSKISSNQESEQVKTRESDATATISEEVALLDLSEKSKVVNQRTGVTSISSASNVYSEPIVFNRRSDTSNLVMGNLNSSQYGKSSESRGLESPMLSNASSVTDPKKKTRTFEAAAAEAELDMLLDSFGETKTRLLDSSGLISGTFPVSQSETSMAVPHLPRNGPGSSKTTSVSANLDDVLDDLLKETSNRNSVYQPFEVKAAPRLTQSSSSAPSVTDSKLQDDFDSWLDTI